VNKQYQVIWTPTAERDLIDILEYIATDSVSTAKKVAKDIEEKAETLDSFPERGRIVPELQNIGIVGYRELIVKRWRLVYRTEQQNVYVLAVLDSRRDLESILLERLLR
jgi:addiction module RelE/StbE family toxin